MSHACGKGIPCTGEAGKKNCYLLQTILPSRPPAVKARLSLRSGARSGGLELALLQLQQESAADTCAVLR